MNWHLSPKTVNADWSRFPNGPHKDGQRVGVQGIARDITERKQAETVLRESQALYHSFVEQLPAAVFRKDSKGRYVMVNSQFCRLKGMKAEDFLGKTAVEVASTELAKQNECGQPTRYAPQGEEVHEQIMRTGKAVETEEEYPGANGEKQYMYVVRMPVFAPSGTVVGTQGILLDITERKRAEMALAESRNYLDKIINSVADPLLVKDSRHRWVLLNDAYCNFMGHKRDELLGKSDYDFFPKSEADQFWSRDELVFNTGMENVSEEEFTDASGKVHTIVTRKALYTDEWVRNSSLALSVTSPRASKRKTCCAKARDVIAAW